MNEEETIDDSLSCEEEVVEKSNINKDGRFLNTSVSKSSQGLNSDVNETELDFEAEEPVGSDYWDKDNEGKEEVEFKCEEKTVGEEGECKDWEDKVICCDIEQNGKNSDLEEGELDDGEDRSVLEPKPVCRFYSRGQCTWGSSCRFIHPGVTDKGNYSMFAPPKPISSVSIIEHPSNSPSSELGSTEKISSDIPPLLVPEQPAVETAWERGLRLSKERIKKALQRKETDVDFEEKKFNLTLGQDEYDKENDYYNYAKQPSPVHLSDGLDDEELDASDRQTLEYWRKARNYVNKPRNYENFEVRVVKAEHERGTARERGGYRRDRYDKESWAKSWEYPNDKELPERERGFGANEGNIGMRGKDRALSMSASPPPRGWKDERYSEVTQAQRGRGDEWADPWMRRKSPKHSLGRRHGRSYSSGSSRSSSRSSSYSSGSRSRSRSSSSSSYSSRSRIASYSSRSSSRSSRSRSRSTSLRRKLPPGGLRGVPTKRNSYDTATGGSKPFPPPGGTPVKKQINPAQPPGNHASHNKLSEEVPLRTITRSHSVSSTSSSSSSSSRSSVGSQAGRRRVSQEPLPPGSGNSMYGKPMTKGLDPLKLSGQKQQIKLTLKGNTLTTKTADLFKTDKGTGDMSPDVMGRKRGPTSPPLTQPPPNKMGLNAATVKVVNKKTSSSRREELLKQLRAVEDAIARKKTRFPQ